MDLVTLGMFIIDEIHYQPPKQPDINAMGGGGLYAALGARLFRPPPSSLKVGWVVHRGHDFPLNMTEIIESWGTSCKFIETPHRSTTRAWNKYEQDGYRSFKYSNDKAQVDEGCLSAEQLMSKTYHLICSAERCVNLVQGIKAKRKQMTKANNTDDDAEPVPVDKPMFIWEPLPALCKPSEFPNFLDAVELVDVVSPNLDEFGSLLDVHFDLAQSGSWNLLTQKCREIVESTSETTETVLVVRLGERGCYVAQRGRYLRLPAYYKQNAASLVVDPTGGGNTFLGGFGIGLLQPDGKRSTDPFEEAALYGTVAASFAIEQVGVPALKRSSSLKEFWNGEQVEVRLERYRQRVKEMDDYAEERSSKEYENL
ncbi:MAG: hypothetical protein L6R41_000641 [Letrouitia leprolyta]|nr:MAG: hypothetical protein L6R41_000641 [Letrouitia leprolyta]